MSDRIPLNPDLLLSDDLAAIEARMHLLAPGASQLNRDELMYQAGWAAARARVDAPRPSLRLWQAATGVLAASLLIALTQLVPDESAAVSSVPIAEVTANTEPQVSTDEPKGPVKVVPYSASIRSTAPLLVMRARALNQDFSELPIRSGSSVSAAPTLTTNQTLIDELLPRTGTSVNAWQSFLRSNLGESS